MKSKYYNKRFFDPLSKPKIIRKKRINTEVIDHIVTNNGTSHDTKIGENSIPTFLNKKRKNPKINKDIIENEIILKAFIQDDISYYSITDLLDLFKQFTGINYENNQLKVNW